MSEWIKAFAPATVANVGPGYDVLGFAVSSPGDYVEVREIDEKDVIISKITGDKGLLSKEPQKNTAGIGVSETLKLLGIEKGVELRLHKNMPLGSGLGSSGASSVAASYATNILFGEKLGRKDLVQVCMKGEEVACGAPHADNVAPAMLGGFVLIRSYHPIDIIPLAAPDNMVAVIVAPDFELKTSDARAAVPKQVSLKNSINNWGNVAAIVASLYKGDIKLLGKSIEDKIVEPARAKLIPGFFDVKKAALDSGAYGCSISGAGPSIFAVTDNLNSGEVIGKAMQEAFQVHGLFSKVFVSKINKEGVKIVGATNG